MRSPSQDFTKITEALQNEGPPTRTPLDCRTHPKDAVLVLPFVIEASFDALNFVGLSLSEVAGGVFRMNVTI